MLGALHYDDSVQREPRFRRAPITRYKICVYAICKDEEQFVDRWMNSVQEADLVVVLDTGSADSTVSKLRARGAQVHEAVVSPWRFDSARNIALDNIPADVDICVSIDMDEVLEPGWRARLEDSWTSDTTSARCEFIEHLDDGSVAEESVAEKAHRRHGYRWVHPVDEVLKFSGSVPEFTCWVDGMTVHHHPDVKPRSQNLELLKLSAEENPDDAQVLFRLGREYLLNEMRDEAVETLNRYLRLPAPRRELERCAAMRFVSRCYKSRGDLKTGQVWLYRAIAEAPETREPYCEMALLAYEAADWMLVSAMVGKTLAITDERSSGEFAEPYCWGYTPYDLGAIAAYALGLYQRAYDYGLKALEVEPDNKRFARNLELAKHQLEQQKSRPPASATSVEFFDVVFYDDIGMAFDPDTVRQRALGGSEFVLWQLANEMGKRGLRVLVWLGKGPDRNPTTHENVTYRYGKSGGSVYARRLIHHRYSSSAYEERVRWEKRWFLCTDLWGKHYETRLTDLSRSFEGTLCVSEWQASFFSPHAKCYVLPNPIPAESYAPSAIDRDPNVFVYASAAMKGLRSTLETWQTLRTRHPELRDTRLRVLSPGYDDPGLAANYDGVELVGAVPFESVTDELRRAAGLFYVNDHPETFCLVAALAEACGARLHIWMRNGGAIRETVNSPLVVTDGRQFESDFVRYYLSDAGAGCAEPRDFSAEHVVDLWTELLGL